jgi:sortase B
LGEYIYETFTAEQEYSTITSSYVTPDVIPVEQQDADTSSWPPIIDWAALQAESSDVSGWIRIPGTTVDYPILTNSESDYYLHRNMYGQYSFAGAIFADYQNSTDLSDNHLVIYGHHMAASTMFHDVANYVNQSYFENHRVIYVETPETTYVLKAVEMYTVEPTETDARSVLFSSSQSFQEYFDLRLARSDYIKFEDYNRATADKLVTLITCNSTGKARQVVECVVEQEYPTEMIPNVIETALSEQEATTADTTTGETVAE